MVTVRASDSRDGTVQSIMDRHSPANSSERRAEYAKGGGTQFDPAAKPCRPSDSELEHYPNCRRGATLPTN